jgi:hypothetical protein
LVAAKQYIQMRSSTLGRTTYDYARYVGDGRGNAAGGEMVIRIR